MYKKYYSFYNFNFSISTDIIEISDEVFSLFSAIISKKKDNACKWIITKNHQYEIYKDSIVAFRTSQISYLIENLEWFISIEILKRNSNFLQFHASGVVKNNKSLLFLGKPGAGKTTLALGFFNKKDVKYLSDEIILYDQEKNYLLPFPRCFHIDLKTVNLLSNIDFKNLLGKHPDSTGKYRFNPFKINQNYLADKVKPYTIIFLENKKRKKIITEIGQIESINLLLEQAINLKEYGNDGICTLLNLIKYNRCYKLNINNIDVSKDTNLLLKKINF